MRADKEKGGNRSRRGHGARPYRDDEYKVLFQDGQLTDLTKLTAEHVQRAGCQTEASMIAGSVVYRQFLFGDRDGLIRVLDALEAPV